MANIFATDPRCKALWSLENGALTADSIGTNTLTASASPPVADVGDFKEKAACGDFDKANNQYLTIADASLDAGFPLKNGDATKKITICCWIKPETLTTIPAIAGKLGYSSTLTAGLALRSADLRYHYNAEISSGITLVVGEWYHVALVIDGVAKTVYIRVFRVSDGHISTYSHSPAAALTIYATPWRIGGYTDYAGSTFNGKIDEVVVFNDLLSATEIDLIRAGNFGVLTLAGTIAGVASAQGNIIGVSTLLEGTIPAVSSITGELTGGALPLGSATVDAVSGIAGTLSSVIGVVNVIPASTGGWAMGGTSVWVSTVPTTTDISLLADAEPTGFYLGGGAEPGEAEVTSTVPGANEIVTEGGAFIFCGPGATGNATTSEPAQDAIEDEVAFRFGGAGVWGQVKPADILSTVLVGSGGFVLSGSGFSLDPTVTPTTTVIVSTGGFVLGRSGLPPIEVTCPGGADRIIDEVVAFAFGGSGTWAGSTPETTAIIGTGGFVLGRAGLPSIEVTYPETDRTIDETVAFEMGGEGAWESVTPGTTVIVSQGAIFVLSGAGGSGASGVATAKSPPLLVITGDATGGFVLGGSGWAAGANDEVFEAWVLSGQAFEPSVWSAFNFNSFAVKGDQAYACGDAGIYLLGGDHDAGEPIQSGARVGPVNFSSAGTKRIRGVVFGQGGSSTRVRVRTDEAEGVFAPDRDTDRVTVSRDLQASEFTVDILNFDELSHLEIFPLRLARR